MNKIAHILNYLRVILRLGFGNVIAVAYYRYQWRSGTLEKLLPANQTADIQPFWPGDSTRASLVVSPALAATITHRADTICGGKFLRFAEIEIDEGENPNWHKGIYAKNAQRHFTHTAINEMAGEDVKLTWDLSRMHWAPRLALAACITNGAPRARYMARLNYLTSDWLTHNGYQRGANWACAHEVALRGLQLILSSILFEQHLGLKPSSSLLTLMEQSWKRVYAVRHYARAQRNNHSLAEHMFLIYAAAFLAAQQVKITPHKTLKKLQHNFAPLVDSLIMKDGGSVLYSSNYHRVFCDMLSYGKILDDYYTLGLFSDVRLKEKSCAAFDFLEALIEPISGQMPLIGHNDGSLHCLQYRGFHTAEPSLILMGAVFEFTVPERTKRHEEAIWVFDYPLKYSRDDTTLKTMQRFDHFGLALFSSATARVYVKYPRHRYRPSQSDFLHMDVWLNGKNILHDSGTYSYNPPSSALCEDLSDMRAHNTLALISRPVITKLSPFLYAFWPNAKVRQHHQFLTMTVPLGQGNQLHRQIEFTDRCIILTDQVTALSPWQVHFHGAISANDFQSAAIEDTTIMQFENIANSVITDSFYASNYQSLAPTKHLAVTPSDMNKPIITTIAISV